MAQIVRLLCCVRLKNVGIAHNSSTSSFYQDSRFFLKKFDDKPCEIFNTFSRFLCCVYRTRLTRTTRSARFHTHYCSSQIHTHMQHRRSSQFKLKHHVFFSIILHSSFTETVTSYQMDKIIVENGRNNGRCLDGSKPGYYHRNTTKG